MCWVLDKMEGAMARNIDSPYEGKRSYNLQKLKDFTDAEYEILGIVEGEGGLAGHVGAFIMDNGDGQRFNSKLIGKFSRLKYLFEHPEEAIGKMATIRFQGFTDDGIPRINTMRCIRGLKDRSDWV